MGDGRRPEVGVSLRVMGLVKTEYEKGKGGVPRPKG